MLAVNTNLSYPNNNFLRLVMLTTTAYILSSKPSYGYLYKCIEMVLIKQDSKTIFKYAFFCTLVGGPHFSVKPASAFDASLEKCSTRYFRKGCSSFIYTMISPTLPFSIFSSCHLFCEVYLPLYI